MPLCLKAGRDADGLPVNRPTEDVVIRDSIIRRGAAAITIGSETSGGFHNIEAYNLTALAGVPSGVLFKSSHGPSPATKSKPLTEVSWVLQT